MAAGGTALSSVTDLQGRLSIRRYFESQTTGEAIFPLLVLTGLYFFDEFDTSAFNTLAPDIKHAFHISNNTFTGLVILNVTLVVLLAIPVGYMADRVRRVPIVVVCGVLAGVFSFLTGLAPTVAVLTIFRLGNGIGLVANGTVHNSLLSDYYTPSVRPRAFAVHTNALYLGAIVAPIVAGLAGKLLGWRPAFFVLFVPIMITTILAIRLHEPQRGGTDGPGSEAFGTVEPVKFWEGVRILLAVRTLKFQFAGAVFLGAGLIPLAVYGPLFLDQAFHVDVFWRGVIGGAQALATFLALQKGGKWTVGWFAQGMGNPVRRAGIFLGGVGIGLGLTAAAPWLWLYIIISVATNGLVGLLFSPYYSTVAFVSPAPVRTLSFSLGSVFLVLGVVLYFGAGLGTISDAYGIRWAVATLVPFWIVAGAFLRYSGKFVAEDAAKAFA